MTRDEPTAGYSSGLCSRSVAIILLVLSLALPASSIEIDSAIFKEKYPVKQEHGADLYMLNYTQYIHYGFYLSLVGQAAHFRKGWGGMIGGRAALLVDHIFAIGAGYELSVAARRSSMESGNYAERLLASFASAGQVVRTVYGGGYLSYHIFHDSIVNFSLGALAGGGHLGGDYAGGPGKNFAILEPELYLFVNLPAHARIGIGTSYRISWGVSYQGISDRDFRGFSIGLQVQSGIM
ncbi:MAG TPA: hypothetical protein PLM53_13255 [Spirochaetota bacterium]|nr:hypothetical protein [Spirochaetota bacterium]HPC40410.1 hypothetical protein [Spirochaetota bacterium]HQF06477.1 hypothetical protein [Spirochaetota bacterium]HQH98062.1 hypothetical protein [Spirochaetota bacterium]HQJ70794.1 hypothetical protein [Spirochaetota bacterium]